MNRPGHRRTAVDRGARQRCISTGVKALNNDATVVFVPGLRQDDPNAGELINAGKPYPASYDKPHDVTFIGNYRINKRLSFSLNATYSTGRPITLPNGIYYYSGSYRTLYGPRNGHRIPDYFRADFSANIEGNHKIRQVFHNSWTIGVYNLTGRKNPYSVYYTSENGTINGYKLSIFGSAIPFITYNIRF